MPPERVGFADHAAAYPAVVLVGQGGRTATTGPSSPPRANANRPAPPTTAVWKE
ncbi:hypothetical protein [Haloterrigena salinisoli]|uniref:hypothetical protein n=1 Tax=Haloterrigena salinisoli TaxID=3132747 RepID=UPI0030CE118C